MSKQYRNVNVTIEDRNPRGNYEEVSSSGCMAQLIIIGVLLLLIACCG